MDVDLPVVGPGAKSNEDEDEQPPATVEYLDYQVIEANDWNIDDDNLFEKAATADLNETVYGVMKIDRSSSLLKGAENYGLKWPFQCRSGRCGMCAGILLDGQVDSGRRLGSFLTEEDRDEHNLRLTCKCSPNSDTVRIVCNALQMPYVQHIVQERG
jgi:ferredoxin